MKTAKLIENLSGDTALFELSHPMKVLVQKDMERPDAAFKEFTLFVAFSKEMSEGYSRTVLHASEKLQGERGVGYGNNGARIIDGVDNFVDAWKISGYTVE